MQKHSLKRPENIDLENSFDELVDNLATDYTAMVSHGSGLNLNTNDTVLSNLRNVNKSLKIKELISLAKKDDIKGLQRCLQSFNNSHMGFKEALFHYICCVLDPFRFQTFIPIPFASGYSLLHYTFQDRIPLGDGTTDVNLVYGKTLNQTSIFVCTGLRGNRQRQQVGIIPPGLLGLIQPSSIQVVSAAFLLSSDASLLNTNGRVYSYNVNSSAADPDPIKADIVNSLVSYNGHVKDGAFVTMIPQPLGFDTPSSSVLGVLIEGTQITITYTFKIVVMCRFISPFNNIVSKLNHSFDSSIYQVNLSEILDSCPDLFASSGTYYSDTKRLRRAEEMSFLVAN